MSRGIGVPSPRIRSASRDALATDRRARRASRNAHIEPGIVSGTRASTSALRDRSVDPVERELLELGVGELGPPPPVDVGLAHVATDALGEQPGRVRLERRTEDARLLDEPALEPPGGRHGQLAHEPPGLGDRIADAPPSRTVPSRRSRGGR